MPNVGINGFCRIGRIVLRTCLEKPEIQVTAINDPAIDIDYMCYLIKFDSTHGKLSDCDVIARRHHSEIKIRDKTIKIFHEKTPGKIPWHLANVQFVVEASGMFTTLEKASGHLANGVQQVIVTAPSVNIPMLVLGVNDQKINTDHKVISTTSSTLYCLAPLVKILEENFGVSEGFITSIHAMTPSLKPLDGLCLRGKYWRDHRSIHQNIIPASTGACKALGKIIPSVKDKLAGTAFRVPIVNVSILDVTIRLNTPTSLADILSVIEQQSLKDMKSIIRISNEEAVSSDFMNESHSCVVDADSSIQLRPNFFKLICWYENEYSYACRVVDSILFTAKLANPILEFDKKIFTLTTNSRISENVCDKSKSLDNFKRKSSDISQESLEKNKTQSRIPKRVSDKSIKDIYTAVETTKVTDEIELDDSACSNFDEHLDLKKDQLNRGTFIITKNTINQSKIKENYTSVPSKKTFIKTLSAVKIFQAQQERLEKVKKEFEKVATFTEDLLNKTKMFNDKLLCLSNESIIGSKEPIEKLSIDVGSNVTYVKYDASSDRKIMQSSECSEEVKNWNFEEYKESTHSRNSENNAITENFAIESANIVADANKTENVIDLKKEGFVTEIDLNNTDEKQNKIVAENIVAKFSMDDTTSAESCNNNVMRYIENEIKSTAGHGQLYNIVNHVVKCNRVPKIMDISEENLNRALPNMSTASKMSGFTTDTLNSKMEMSKDLSDLYDKLDSVSNTGSESSFPEKKSQIIKFADLSPSMDELEKIDQFCKIIEISDEISDHLFAALSKNGTVAPKNQWSFGELCKKINLDDFCKKIFKKP